MVKRPFPSPLTDDLWQQVHGMVDQSSYNVVVFRIDENCFGNVYLEIQNNSRQVRFIQDRGDIYVEKKALTSSQWSELFFVSHSNSSQKYYDSLLKSLSKVLNS